VAEAEGHAGKIETIVSPEAWRLVSSYYDGEARGDGCMLLQQLSAAQVDPGEQGVSDTLADCLVAYELLTLQRKQQSQLLLNAHHHEAPLFQPTTIKPSPHDNDGVREGLAA
jgi:hypothetical protein